MRKYIYCTAILVVFLAGHLTAGNAHAAAGGVPGDIGKLQGQVDDVQNTLEEILSLLSPAAKKTTTLLWPFATNQAGFDTGIAISNTSEPGGPSGTCQLTFHSSGTANTTKTTPTIPAGGGAGNSSTYVDLVSVLAPNFQGYIIAVCNFPRARGYGLITDIGARNLAASITVEVLP